MHATKADIIAQLQRDILFLQGFKPIAGNESMNIGLGPMMKQVYPVMFKVNRYTKRNRK